LANGDAYRGGGQKLHADIEVAVELGDDLRPARYGVALEICDLAEDGSIEDVVVGNDYHRAVAFGPFAPTLPRDLEGALIVNGKRRAAGGVADDLDDRVAAVGRVLAAVGESLRPGDRVITGLIVNTPVASGDHVMAELGALGRVSLRVG
jgi:2-keto-4-pentenoate hydratase